jgi:hypothetical protein
MSILELRLDNVGGNEDLEQVLINGGTITNRVINATTSLEIQHDGGIAPANGNASMTIDAAGIMCFLRPGVGNFMVQNLPAIAAEQEMAYLRPDGTFVQGPIPTVPPPPPVSGTITFGPQATPTVANIGYTYVKFGNMVTLSLFSLPDGSTATNISDNASVGIFSVPLPPAITPTQTIKLTAQVGWKAINTDPTDRQIMKFNIFNTGIINIIDRLNSTGTATSNYILENVITVTYLL